jgi:hypothetical protein
VGIAGKRESSVDLAGVDRRSCEHGGTDAVVDMMQRSRLVIGQNSGLAHLAVFLERPMVMMRTGSGMICWMNVQRNPDVFFEIVEPAADAAFKAALDYLAAH